jgi:hypothetical protein
MPPMAPNGFCPCWFGTDEPDEKEERHADQPEDCVNRAQDLRHRQDANRFDGMHRDKIPFTGRVSQNRTVSLAPAPPSAARRFDPDALALA